MSNLTQKAKSILIVESDDKTVNTLINYLKQEFACEVTKSAKAAINLIHERSFPVILINYANQNVNGSSFLSFIREFSPNTSVIYLNDTKSFADATAAFRAGAFDFIAKPFELQQVEVAVKKAFEESESKSSNEKHQLQLEEIIIQKTEQMDKALEEVENSYQGMIRALVQALETRDSETHGHSERVVTFSLRLAHEAGLEEEKMRDLELGALLHDIGKIGVPDMILRKNAKLDEKDWEKMKLHPLQGFQILRNIPYLKDAAKIVKQHHERWDGKGYPHGLRGEEIGICARIFAVADAFDAMISDRVYRKGRSFEEAKTELKKYAGTQFDPEIVRAFQNIPPEDWETLQTRSLKNKQELFSFQAIVEELVRKDQYFEMVH